MYVILLIKLIIIRYININVDKELFHDSNRVQVAKEILDNITEGSTFFERIITSEET